MANTIQVPGKLYLMGEYSILQAGQGAILCAVNAYLSVTGQAALKGQLVSDIIAEPLNYTLEDGRLIMEKAVAAEWKLVKTALEIAYEYIGEGGFPLSLRIESEMNHADNKKYGFGSSGAVTLGVITNVLKVHHIPYTASVLFKLAAIAMLKGGSRGSMGDIATSVMGGWIYYEAFDRSWVEEQLQHLSLQKLVHSPWPNLLVMRLDAPSNMQVAVGWTGTPASTESFVQKLQRKVKNEPLAYERFLKDAQKIVRMTRQAFIKGDGALILRGVKAYGELLSLLGEAYRLPILTPSLRNLSQLAEQVGFAGKLSGAGGGDCGIAIGFSKDRKEDLYKAWEAKGIKSLREITLASRQNEEREIR